MMNKTLVILERNNGWYGGYEKCGNEYIQVFNTNAAMLFLDVKHYTDKGYSIVCLDKSQESEFMRGRTTLEDFLANQNDV